MFRLLQGGERSVGDIAAELPVSRPAVSQHLRVLKEAALVTDRPDGVRRLYSVRRTGLEALRAELETMWDDALAAFAAAADEAGPERPGEPAREPSMIEPIHRSITVRRAPADAFRLFTAEMGSWWPLDTHGRADEHEGVKTERLVVEEREGGRVYEVLSNGLEADWGVVTAWEPPTRVCSTGTRAPTTAPTPRSRSPSRTPATAAPGSTCSIGTGNVSARRPAPPTARTTVPAGPTCSTSGSARPLGLSLGLMPRRGHASDHQVRDRTPDRAERRATDHVERQVGADVQPADQHAAPIAPRRSPTGAELNATTTVSAPRPPRAPGEAEAPGRTPRARAPR